MKYAALIFAFAALVAAGCSNGSNDTENGGTATTSSTTGGTANNTAGGTSTTVAYSTIQDALTKNCVQCHGANAPKANLDLSSYDTLMKGGKDGAVVKPGDANNSLLVKVLAPDNKPHMPPKGQVDDATIGALKSWINAGAKNG